MLGSGAVTAESQSEGGQEQISEEELRLRLADEMKKIQVHDVLLQTVVTLINLGGQRLGVTQDTKDARNPEQTRLAIEAVRALIPLLEENNPDEVGPVRDALAQLQMAYARETAPGEKSGAAPPPADERLAADERGAERPAAEPGSRGSSGLWVPPGSET